MSLPEPLCLTLPAPVSELSFGEIFIHVYEHFNNLRQRGYHAEAAHMDTSPNVTGLVRLVENGSELWTSLDRVWSAKDFRTVLYNAIAADAGGPLWLRQAVTTSLADLMCLTRMPHVWETTFNEAKNFTAIFVEPGHQRYNEISQQISQSDIASVRDLWIEEMPQRAVRTLADRFFPEVPRDEKGLFFYTPLMGKTHHYRVEIFQNLQLCDHCNVFNRLARRRRDGPPLPPFIDTAYISAQVHQAAFLTTITLPHIMCWYGSQNLLGRIFNDPSCQWHEVLADGPFMLRSFSPSGSLVHGNMQPGEAARHFIHALFDQIRSGVRVEASWMHVGQAVQIVRNPLSIFEYSLAQIRDCQPGWANVITLAESYLGSLWTLQAEGHLPPTALEWM